MCKTCLLILSLYNNTENVTVCNVRVFDQTVQNIVCYQLSMFPFFTFLCHVKVYINPKIVIMNNVSIQSWNEINCWNLNNSFILLHQAVIPFPQHNNLSFCKNVHFLPSSEYVTSIWISTQNLIYPTFLHCQMLSETLIFVI